MDAHLLDTNFVSAFFDRGSNAHVSAQAWMSASKSDVFYLPAITVGEVQFGAKLALDRGGGLSPETRDFITRLTRMPLIVPVTEQTAEFYARVKAGIAMAKFPRALEGLGKKKLSKPETWIDEITGANLGIDENDLWICAIALERNFNLVTFDTDMSHAKLACPELRLTLLS